MTHLPQLALLTAAGICAYIVARAWADVMAWAADSGCICRKGGWNPECPVHGRAA